MHASTIVYAPCPLPPNGALLDDGVSLHSYYLPGVWGEKCGHGEAFEQTPAGIDGQDFLVD